MVKITIYIVFISCFLLTEEQIQNSFTNALAEKGFVDRTLLIKDFIGQKENKWLITAPPGFGKTVNIDMIKTFSEIAVTPNGERIPVYQRDNFKVFSKVYDFGSLKITKDQQYFLKHLGQYPVLFFSFKNVNVQSTSEDFMKSFWEQVIKPACQEHKNLFLLNKTADVGNITRLCQGKYSHTELSSFGAEFVDALYKHFGKKVIVLGDEIDAPLKGLLLHPHLTENITNFIIEVIKNFFSALGSSAHIEKALLSAALRVDWAYVSTEFNSKKKRATYAYERSLALWISRYYLTETEVKNLGAQFGATRSDFDRIKTWLGGYRVERKYACDETNPRETFYAVHQVKKYFQHPHFAHCSHSPLRPFLRAFLLPHIRRTIIKLLEEKASVSHVTEGLSFTSKSLMGLNRVIKSNVSSNADSQHEAELFIELLLEEGYLTLDGDVPVFDESASVGIPNALVESELRTVLNEAFQANYGLPKEVRSEFIHSLGLLDGTEDSCRKNLKSIVSLVEHSHIKPKTKEELWEIIFHALFSDPCPQWDVELRSDCREYEIVHWGKPENAEPWATCEIVAYFRRSCKGRLGGDVAGADESRFVRGIDIEFLDGKSGEVEGHVASYRNKIGRAHSHSKSFDGGIEVNVFIGLVVSGKECRATYLYNSSSMNDTVTLRANWKP